MLLHDARFQVQPTVNKLEQADANKLYRHLYKLQQARYVLQITDLGCVPDM